MKLSIIVPVYNAEKHLDKTIANILQQTFTDFELLLIDDESKDDSGIICDTWSKKDSRIKVIHQKNTGVGGARNTGLDAAQGEYIGFADNDDLIHPQMYEILLGIAEKEHAEIVMSIEQKRYEFDNLDFPDYLFENVNYELISIDESYMNMFDIPAKDGPYMAVWNKVYRRDSIKNTRFPLKGSEDLVFNSRIFGSVKKIILLDESVCLYYWMQYENSQFHNLSSGYKANILSSYFQMADELNSNFPEYSHYAKEKAMKVVLSTRYNFKNTAFKSQVKHDIKKNISVLKKSFLSDKRIHLSHKIGLLIFYYFPFTYALFRKIID